LSKDEKLVLLQNFVPEFKPKEDCQKSDCWVVASRLSREKGIRALVENWPRGLRLDIYGEGEDSVPIRTMRKPGVRLRGQITRDRLVGELSGYAGLVFPSLWFEGNPSIVLEAFQAGIPVVAKQGSSGADIVVEHGAGKVYSDERIDLHWALIQAAQQAEDLGTRGRDAYSTFFSSEVWCVHAEALMATIVNTKT
jgi:glycosyltransferase involved in cell wall biosynthesis